MEHEEQEQREERIPVEELLAAYIPKQEAPEPVEEAPRSEEEPEKPSKKRILMGVVAAVTAVALIVGAIVLRRPEEPDPAPVPDGGFYLLTKATEYHPDGSKGYSQTIYTYDQRGFPLTITTDWGYAEDQVWNNEAGIYESVYASFDGKADRELKFVYNENGDILYRLETKNTYDENGTLTNRKVDQSDRDQHHIYHYDMEGRIESVDTYATMVGGGTGDIAQTLTHHYDDHGRLVEVFGCDRQKENRLDSYVFDFRYDDAGRLTIASNRPKEGLYYYRYEYDDAGRLIRVELVYGGHSDFSCVDEHSVNRLEYQFPDISRVEKEARFTYDSEGRLLSRCAYEGEEKLLHQTDCTYQDGKLAEVTFRTNATETVYRYAAEGNGKDITLAQDINGNIIRQINPDGSYIEYEYQRFDLSDADIQRAKNVRYLVNGMDLMGEMPYWGVSMPTFEGGYACLADVPYPTTVLYETDILRNE